MPNPNSHPLGRNSSESATLIFLTRLAMLFERHRSKQFSGDEVAQIILGAWQSYELSKDTPEIEAFIGQHSEFFTTLDDAEGYSAIAAGTTSREAETVSKQDVGLGPAPANAGGQTT